MAAARGFPREQLQRDFERDPDNVRYYLERGVALAGPPPQLHAAPRDVVVTSASIGTLGCEARGAADTVSSPPDSWPGRAHRAERKGAERMGDNGNADRAARDCTLSADVLTDSPEEAREEVVAFESRLRDKVLAFRAEICASHPSSTAPLIELTLPAYLRHVANCRFDEAVEVIRREIAALPPQDPATLFEIKATISEERRWIRERLEILRLAHSYGK